jgi:hypothetical protein
LWAVVGASRHLEPSSHAPCPMFWDCGFEGPFAWVVGDERDMSGSAGLNEDSAALVAARVDLPVRKHDRRIEITSGAFASAATTDRTAHVPANRGQSSPRAATEIEPGIWGNNPDFGARAKLKSFSGEAPIPAAELAARKPGKLSVVGRPVCSRASASILRLA